MTSTNDKIFNKKISMIRMVGGDYLERLLPINVIQRQIFRIQNNYGFFYEAFCKIRNEGNTYCYETKELTLNYIKPVYMTWETYKLECSKLCTQEKKVYVATIAVFTNLVVSLLKSYTVLLRETFLKIFHRR